MEKNFILDIISGGCCMIETADTGDDGRLSHLFGDFELERIARADKKIDPVNHWWLDA
jgi:hypothetical protein